MKLNQIYWAPKETLERLLQVEEVRKAAGYLWLEFHEHIDVTVLRIKVTT